MGSVTFIDNNINLGLLGVFFYCFRERETSYLSRSFSPAMSDVLFFLIAGLSPGRGVTISRASSNF